MRSLLVFLWCIGICCWAQTPTFFYKDGDAVSARSSLVQARMEVGRAELTRSGVRVTIEYVGARAVSPQPSTRQSGLLHMLMGSNQAEWRTDLPLYSEVFYQQLYPGVDLYWRAAGRTIKSEFFIAPGTDPSIIRLRYLAGGSVRVDADGALIVSTGSGEFRELAPNCFTRTSPVACRYVLNEDEVGFRVDDWDKAEPLIIDPVVTYSTYVGGSGVDVATGVATDASGNAYVCGYTDSTNFPLVGALSGAQGSVDAFVFEFNASGNQLLYATYIGGNGDDRAFGCALDSSGSLHVVGATSSTNFPIIPSASSNPGGGRDAFTLKLSSNGSQLLYSRLLGGASSEAANAVAVDSAGNAFVVGETSSTNFPVTAAFQPSNRGRQDAFVTKLNVGGSVLFSTYLGGTGDERALGVAVDNQGGVYVAGGTTSTDFPVLSAYQNANAGGQDCFVTKLVDTGASVVYSSYLGGSGGSTGLQEQCNSIAVDSGNAYVAGSTPSTNFPLINPLQTAIAGGGIDGFVAKFAAAGNALAYSTYFGTSGIDQLLSVAVDAGGQAYVAGKTSGTALPLADPIQSTFAGGSYDGYMARIKAAGSSLDFSSYFGGNGGDSANAIAVNSSGKVIVAGQTTSTNLPLTKAYQSFGAAEGSAFVVSFGLTPPTVAPQPPSTGPAADPSSSIDTRQRFTFQLSDPNGFQDISVVSVVTAASASTGPPNCHVYYNRGTNLFYLYSDTNTPLGPIAPGSAATLENSQCKFYAATSSAVGSVNTLTLTVDIERKMSYYGAKNVYVWLNDITGRSAGLDQKAIWNITAQNLPPTTGPSASPSAITSARQTVSFAPTDPNGFADIAIVSAVISSSAAAPPGTCHAYYNRFTNLFYLLSDSNQTLGPLTPGSGNALQNSQCILYGQNSSASGTGTTLNISFDLEMLPLYSGLRNVYLWVNDSLNSSAGLDAKGTWDIPAAPNVAPTTGPNATPNPASGTRNVFRFVPTDANGYQDIRVVSVVVHATASVVQNSCHVYLNRLTNLFYLYSDTNTSLGPATPGSSTILENSQCRFYAATSSVSGSGPNLTLDVDIERKAAYNGTKGVYLWLNDSKNAATGMDLKSTWNMP